MLIEQLKSAEQCKRSAENLCRFVGDGSCSVDYNKNSNFMDMINNEINYTCNCEEENAGFE